MCGYVKLKQSHHKVNNIYIPFGRKQDFLFLIQLIVEVG